MWFQQSVVAAGKLRLFCFFASFIATFLFIRFSVRMIRAQVRWWPGNVTPGGVHVHHAVFGLIFMCIGGVGGLVVQETRSGWAAGAAALLGIGMALVLDEFALVLFLKDVYWSEQGRLSVEVVFIAVALCGLALLGWLPLGITPSSGRETRLETLLGIALVLAVNLSLTVICLLKGKTWFWHPRHLHQPICGDRCHPAGPAWVSVGAFAIFRRLPEAGQGAHQGGTLWTAGDPLHDLVPGPCCGRSGPRRRLIT